MSTNQTADQETANMVYNRAADLMINQKMNDYEVK